MSDRSLSLLLTVALIVLLYNLHHWDITLAEAPLAEISREMLRGDYLHPRLLGIDTYAQPPLAFWLMALGQRLWGVNPFGVRFFVQIALVVQAGLVFHIALRLLGMPKAALFGGLIYLSLPLTLWSSRLLSVEVFLTTFELSAVYWLLILRLEGLRRSLYGLSLSLGLGCLVGGIRVLVLPLLLWAYMALVSRQWGLGAVRGWHALAAGFLGLAVGGGWYLYAVLEQPQLWDYFWQRSARLEPSWRDWWQWLLLLGWGTLPWLPIFLTGLGKPLWANPRVGQLALFWLVPLLALLGSTAVPQGPTLLSVLAGVAILTGYLLQQLPKFQVRRYGLLFVQLAMMVGLLALAIPLLSRLLGESLAVSGPMVLVSLAVFGLGAVLFGLIRVGLRFRLVAIALATNLLLLLYGGYLIDANPLWRETVTPVARVIRDRQLQDLPILVFNQALPALAFELDRDVITIDDGAVTPNVQFQTRSAWRDQWISTQQPDTARYLRRLISRPSVLVVEGDLPPEWNWLGVNYPAVEPASQWQVFYRSG